MQNNSSKKPQVIKDYSALDTNLQEKIKMRYPDGLEKHFIRFTNKDGIYSKAIPFETEDKKYLIRMSNTMAKDIDRNNQMTTDITANVNIELSEEE